MPVILIEKDPFVEAFETKLASQDTEQFNVRRPLFGISIKEATYASISVVTSTGEKVALIDSSGPAHSDNDGKSGENHNFILQSVQFSRQERVQIQETFGDFYTFFFGERPSTANISGILMNTVDFNWKNEFMRNYDKYLRGTKCVETRSRVYLAFDDVVLEGYVLNVSNVYSAQNPYLVPFSFSFLITNYMDLSEGSGGYVSKAGDARTISGSLAEYVTRFGTPDGLVEYSIEGGEWSSIGSFATAEALQDASPSVSMSGFNNREKLFLSPSEAMIKMDVDAQVQEKGADRVTALLSRVRGNPSSFPLAGRSDAVTTIESSLESQVSNGSAVIPSQPTISS